MQPSEIDGKKLEATMLAYELAVRTQMHFNEVGLKLRSLAATLCAAYFGLIAAVIGSLAKNGYDIPVLSYRERLLISFPVLLLWGAIYFLDAEHYHKLLKASTVSVESLEHTIYNEFDIRLSGSRTISSASHARDEAAKTERRRAITTWQKTLTGFKNLPYLPSRNSISKIRTFYLLGLLAMVSLPFIIPF